MPTARSFPSRISESRLSRLFSLAAARALIVSLVLSLCLFLREFQATSVRHLCSSVCFPFRSPDDVEIARGRRQISVLSAGDSDCCLRAFGRLNKSVTALISR